MSNNNLDLNKDLPNFIIQKDGSLGNKLFKDNNKKKHNRTPVRLRKQGEFYKEANSPTPTSPVKVEYLAPKEIKFGNKGITINRQQANLSSIDLSKKRIKDVLKKNQTILD